MTILIRRFASFYVDALVAMLAQFLFLLAIENLYHVDVSEVRFVFPTQMLSLFIYFFVAEFFFSKTVGKKLLKFRVEGIESSSKKRKLIQILARTVSRFIPFEPFSILLDERRLMWHDKLSKTQVVDIRGWVA